MLRGSEASYKGIVNSEPGTKLFYEFEEPTGWAICHDSNNDSQATHHDGTITGCTLEAPGIQGTRGYYYDGTGDRVNMPASFNPLYVVDWGREFTVEACLKVFNAGVWTDGNSRIGFYVAVDANNIIWCTKTDAPNNNLRVRYTAGGIATSRNITMSDTDWFHTVLTIDVPADEMRVYINGAQQGATLTGLGVWAGALAIGAAVGANWWGATAWYGWIDNVAVTERCLTPAEVLERAQRLGLA